MTTPPVRPISAAARPPLTPFREPLNDASQRLRALASLSGSLTDALEPEQAAKLVQDEALALLGASSAVVLTLGAFASVATGEVVASAVGTLAVLHGIGPAASIALTSNSRSPQSETPLGDVAHDGVAVFLASPQELLRYPEWGDAIMALGTRAAAIVPVWANGELRGVLGLTWDEVRTFDEDERAFVITLGVMCAQAIMRAYLRAAEQLAREDAVRARAVAEAANQAKAQFVAVISHELRTPMNAVLGYTALLFDELYGPVSAVQKDHLTRVRDSGKHLLGLVEDLLSFARAEAGVELVNPAKIGLVDVVEASMALVRPLAEQKGLRIHLDAPARSVVLYTDPGKLRQILVNLLANAVKFSDTGDVAVVLRVEGVDTNVKVYFDITDTGRGMSPKSQEHAFDPFWQADPTKKYKEGSSGLGLSVARQLARLLGGEVIVSRSALGEGSTFVLSLPARYVPATGT